MNGYTVSIVPSNNTWSGPSFDYSWSNQTLINNPENKKDSLMNFKYNQHQTIFFNEFEIDFKSSSKKRSVICNGKEIDNIQMIEETFPNIEQDLIALAQIINFLSQDESYEVELNPPPVILWDTFTFYVKSSFFIKSLYKVTLPWPIEKDSNPRYELVTRQSF